MAESIWEAGKLRAVYNPIGRRENGERRFRRANFDVLEWKPNGSRATYIVPLGITRIAASETNLREAEGFGHEFGYYDLDPIIIEPHEGDGKSDSWMSLHAFGYL